MGNDEILVSSNDKKVVINKRAFKYPLLIEFEEDNDTTMKFQFDFFKGIKSLLNHLINLERNKPFLWVDRCESMNTVTFPQSRDYCKMFGRAATNNIKYSVIKNNIGIPVKNIYHPIAKGR